MRRLWAAAAIVLVSLTLLQHVVRLGSETVYREKLQKGEYGTAAELYPEREEVYEKILSEGVSSGRTLRALEQVDALRSLYPEETASHQHILLEMGMIWFLGNPLDALNLLRITGKPLNICHSCRPTAFRRQQAGQNF